MNTSGLSQRTLVESLFNKQEYRNRVVDEHPFSLVPSRCPMTMTFFKDAKRFVRIPPHLPCHDKDVFLVNSRCRRKIDLLNPRFLGYGPSKVPCDGRVSGSLEIRTTVVG